MAFLAAIPYILSALGTAAGVAGSAMQNSAAIKQGKEAQKFKNEQAQAVEAEAGDRMLAERENKERIISRATALAAAGGGGVSDPTVQKILGDIEGEGQYRELLTLYQGEREAKLLRDQGKALKQEGRDRADAYGAEGIATALKGASSIYSAYNQSRINDVDKVPEITNETRNGVRAVSPNTTRSYTPRTLRRGGYG